MEILKPYYQQDEITIYNGDCIEIMRTLEEKSVDMILTDPPYGIKFCSSRTNRKEFIVNDGLKDWEILMKNLLEQFFRVMTDSCCCCCCCGGGGGKTPVTAMLTMKIIKNFNLIQTLVWKKFIGLGWKYRPSYENIIVFSKNKNYSFYDTSKKCSNVIEGINQKIPRYNKKNGGMDDHPTVKPVSLMEHLMKIHSKEGDLVLDPFMGSGTTLIAAKKLKRRSIGIELKKEYCDIAIKRLQENNKTC